MAEALWVGVDLGTSGIRASVHEASGRLRGTGAVSLRPAFGEASGDMTQEPERDWWQGACQALRNALRYVGPGEVAGVGLSGLFPCVCVVDADGRALTEGLLYGDRRGRDETAKVASRLGRPMETDAVLPRLLWLARAHAGLRDGVWALGPQGFLGFRLTSHASLDSVSAARWGGRSTDGAAWDEAALEDLGVPQGLMPPAMAAVDVIGSVTAEAAGATGLPGGVPVIAGTTDSLAQMLGCGVLDPGQAMISYSSTGTLLVIERQLADALADRRAFDGVMPYRRAVHALGSGLLADTMRRELLGDVPVAELDAEAAALPLGAEGVRVIPSSGDVQTQIAGLREAHRRGHIWRAAMEAFGYLLASAELPEPPTAIIAVGGGTRTGTWCQIVSDLTGWTQERAVAGAASRGAAHLAQIGISGAPPAGEGSDWYGGSRTIFRPEEGDRERTNALLERWAAARAAAPILPRR